MNRYLSSLVLFLTTLCGAWAAQANDELNDALIYHAYFGNAQAIEKLIQKGADPNTKDEHGWPLIAVASDRNDGHALPISTVLINAGADINVAAKKNYPIFNAIKHKNKDLVALFIAHNINLKVTNPRGMTVQEAAAKTSNRDIIDIISQRVFEEDQANTFLKSKQHLIQLTSRYRFHHCARNYWGYYFRSKQDKDMNKAEIRTRIRHHSTQASLVARNAQRYFTAAYNQHYDVIASEQRSYINDMLNELISNRNRRVMGVGQMKDMLKRCYIIKTPAHFHSTAIAY